MSFDNDEDGNHKNCAFNYFRVTYCSYHCSCKNTDKMFQENLFLNKKSVYYTSLHKKGENVTINYAH